MPITLSPVTKSLVCHVNAKCSYDSKESRREITLSVARQSDLRSKHLSKMMSKCSGNSERRALETKYVQTKLHASCCPIRFGGVLLAFCYQWHQCLRTSLGRRQRKLAGSELLVHESRALLSNPCGA